MEIILPCLPTPPPSPPLPTHPYLQSIRPQLLRGRGGSLDPNSNPLTLGKEPIPKTTSHDADVSPLDLDLECPVYSATDHADLPRKSVEV